MNAFTAVNPAIDHKSEQCRNKHAVKLLANNCAAEILEQIDSENAMQIADEHQFIEDKVDSLT